MDIVEVIVEVVVVEVIVIIIMMKRIMGGLYVAGKEILKVVRNNFPCHFYRGGSNL